MSLRIEAMGLHALPPRFHRLLLNQIFYSPADLVRPAKRRQLFLLLFTTAPESGGGELVLSMTQPNSNPVLPIRFTAEQKAILIQSDDEAQVQQKPISVPTKVLLSTSQQSSQRSTIAKSSVHKPAATRTTGGAHMIELSNPFSALDDLIDT
uniref:Uncharacterized protein n=1 Tax=Brassica oleracea var. oleracea TaxID=109376 RepID=A0A0D3A846_BRAOL